MSDTHRHKNVLMLIADDLGKYIGAYGSDSTKTPCMDAFAADATRGSIRFDNAFASTASCSGSRSTIYTGMHTHENGQYGLNIFRTHFQTFPYVETAPRLFNEANYHTGIIGKVHVGPDEVYPWQVRIESESRDVAWVADQAEVFFATSKEQDRPFFLTVGYVDPHRDVYSRGGFGNQMEYDPRIEKLVISPKDVVVPSWLSDLPEVRQELAEYLQAVNRTDQGIGMVLEALERQGLAEDTLVIITSDNGPPFLNAKTTLYDAGTCLPLMIRLPQQTSNSSSTLSIAAKTARSASSASMAKSPVLGAGLVNPNMISFIDILPTLLDYAGIPIKKQHGADAAQYAKLSVGAKTADPPSPPLNGRSFLPILHRTDIVPESEWQHHIFGSHTFHELQNYWPTRVIRTRRYKYHRNIAWRLEFPFATDLYASLTYQGIRAAAAAVTTNTMSKADAAAEAGKGNGKGHGPSRNGDGDGAVAPVIGKRTLEAYLFRPKEELFDLENDPDELINLINDPAHADIARGLRRTLEEWQLKTHDLWLTRDGQSIEVLQRYAKDGLLVPDTLDTEIKTPVGELKMVRVDSIWN